MPTTPCRTLFLIAVSILLTASPGRAATRSPGEDKDKDKEKEDEPKWSVTEHSVAIAGKTIKYTATAGHMVLKDFSDKKAKEDEKAADEKDEKDEKGEKADKAKDKSRPHKPLAKMFFIAYTREPASGAPARPLTFCFNGGPGSSSVWLHMGGLGPRRAVLTENGDAPPPPYRAQDNEHSWLDDTDLVFIDPVSTGYSRAEKDEDPKKYHGYEEDIESVAEFIRLYTTKNMRWTSPKLVVGESYGGTRAAGLTEYLQHRYGIYLNGIVLVSPALDFTTIDFTPGNDLPYVLFLPGYAATAWYHKRLSPDLQALALPDLVAKVEEFATHEYRQALFDGDRLPEDRRNAIAAQLSAYTGLPAPWIAQINLRITDELFFTRLLMERNREVGRFDSRYTGIRYSPGREAQDFDPSYEAVNGPYTTAVNDTLRRHLKFDSELPYETLVNVWPWRFKKFETQFVNVTQELRKAMSRNPHLKVWFACGRYDLATPYFASRYTVDQLALDPAIRGNVRLTYYDAGHMMYVYRPALIALKSDFTAFLKEALQPESAAYPATAR